MSIRKKLKEKCVIDIHLKIEQLSMAASQIVEGTGITPEELCKLVANPDHSNTLRRQLITRMVNKAEDLLVARLDAEDEPS